MFTGSKLATSAVQVCKLEREMLDSFTCGVHKQASLHLTRLKCDPQRYEYQFSYQIHFSRRYE